MAQRPQASPVVRNAAAPPPTDEAPEVELETVEEPVEDTEPEAEEPADSED